MPQLSLTARLYIAVVVASACALIGLALGRFGDVDVQVVVILLLLHIVGESLLARGSRDIASISLGSVTSLAAIFMVGTWGAVLVAWSAALARDSEPTPGVKRLFNGAQLALSAGAAGAVYQLMGGAVGLTAADFPEVLVPILVADVVHCLVNGGLVAVVVGLDRHVSPIRVIQGTMAHSVGSYLAYGLFGVSLAVLWQGAEVGPTAALLLLLPLFVARWAYAQYAEEQRAYDRTVRALMTAVETKDFYTRGHSERVSAASVLIARVIGMREDRVQSLRYAGMLHDVGKLGVPTRVLQKNAGLTEAEFEAIQRHPGQGVEIIREIDEAVAGIRHHHERLDGRGYPMGLAGNDIPEFARVIAVADAFDSMTTTRSYRGARSVEEALAELLRCAGNQFDPRMVEALVSAVDSQGWVPEATAVAAPKPPRDAPFDQEAGAFDHDDPTSPAPVGDDLDSDLARERRG
jgi:HD-GYP domain-containing protein (c-di-GMP phosphodiesterase class II)